MQSNQQMYTKHALDRTTARNIPQGIVSWILEYGEPVKARDGAEKFALSKQSLRKVKRDYGNAFANATAVYRNVYVVMNRGKVITVAWARTALIQ